MICADETHSRQRPGRRGDSIKGQRLPKHTQWETTFGTQSEPKKMLKKWRGPFQVTEVHQGGHFDRLSTGRAAHYEKIKPHNARLEDSCISVDVHEDDYLIVDHACELNKRATHEKNHGNDVVNDCDLR